MSASLQPFFTDLAALLSVAAPWLALAAILLALGCLAYAAALKRRFARLMLGRSGSIEESVAVLLREIKDLKKSRGEVEHYLKVAETRLRGSVRGVGIVRFNPFRGDGSGGNQSFAIALLDEEGSGVVFSSLYARDRVGMYGKPVEKGTSSSALTDEEKEAVAQARQNALAYKKK